MGAEARMRGEGRLRRIIALLLSFALLAERAAQGSPAVRFVLLWLLRRADSIATGYAFAASGAPLPDGAPAGPADALALAARFRALAAALALLLPVKSRNRRRPAARSFSCARTASGAAPRALPVHDTS